MDVPFDYAPYASTLGVVLGGLALSVAAVLSAALLIRAIVCGVPRLLGFFVTVSSDTGLQPSHYWDAYDAAMQGGWSREEASQFAEASQRVEYDIRDGKF